MDKEKSHFGLAPFPWQDALWQYGLQCVKQQCLPHGIVIYGPPGVGKNHFVSVFNQRRFCLQPELLLACGKCASCHQFQAGTHPDYYVLSPEDSSSIGIDRIRVLAGDLVLSSHYGLGKTAVISPAEAMTPAAANALLKTLEEPVPGTVIFLLTSQYHGLLATVRSRCQRFVLSTPPLLLAQSWLVKQDVRAAQASLLLALAQGSPLRALELSQLDWLQYRDDAWQDFCKLLKAKVHPTTVATRWLKHGIHTPLYWLNLWAVDLIRLQHSSHPPRLFNPDYREAMLELSQQLSPRGLNVWYQQLLAATAGLKVNANEQLLMESLLIQLKSHGQKTQFHDTRY